MTGSVLKQLAELPTLSGEELKRRWRSLYGTDPPTYNKKYLIRRLAYRIQELAFGGLSKRTREHLEQLAATDTFGNKNNPMERRRRKGGMPIAGTRLVREWNGRRYEVTVVRGGFEFEGRRYRSLSGVTKAITGGHRNGPAFFGLPRMTSKGEGA